MSKLRKGDLVKINENYQNEFLEKEERTKIHTVIRGRTTSWSGKEGVDLLIKERDYQHKIIRFFKEEEIIKIEPRINKAKKQIMKKVERKCNTK